MRLFIAIEFPKQIRAEVSGWMRLLEREIPDPHHKLRWVKEDQLHLTLKFLGETREDQLEPLRQALRITGRNHGSFPISLAKVGHFGRRVIWLGIKEGLENVTTVANSIEELGDSLGFVRENRHFHPHITLARSKTNPGPIRVAELPPTIADRAFGPFPAVDVCLIRSTLTPSGSIYETLERVPLLRG